MRSLLLASVLCLVALVRPPASQPAAAETPPSPLRVMSFNIRYDNPGDGEHRWANRRPLVASVVRFHEVDLLGVQEALDHQVRQLAEDLPGMDWTGVGRDDGKAAGEYAAIFYNRERLEVRAHGTFWLSPTPEAAGSKGWDAALPRIATWARFRDRAGGGEFLAVNTHFDHRGEQARRESARLLVERATALADGLPVVITGDFNSEPDSQAYRTMAAALQDARSAAPGGPFGPEGTFGTFVPHAGPAPRIDYIFLSEGVAARRSGTLSYQWAGRHASDHFPVYAEVVLPDR